MDSLLDEKNSIICNLRAVVDLQNLELKMNNSSSDNAHDSPNTLTAGTNLNKSDPISVSKPQFTITMSSILKTEQA